MERLHTVNILPVLDRALKTLSLKYYDLSNKLTVNLRALKTAPIPKTLKHFMQKLLYSFHAVVNFRLLVISEKRS